MAKIGKSLLKNREFPLLESFSLFIFAVDKNDRL